jgi:hypothetical protein
MKEQTTEFYLARLSQLMSINIAGENPGKPLGGINTVKKYTFVT